MATALPGPPLRLLPGIGTCGAAGGTVRAPLLSAPAHSSQQHTSNSNVHNPGAPPTTTPVFNPHHQRLPAVPLHGRCVHFLPHHALHHRAQQAARKQQVVKLLQLVVRRQLQHLQQVAVTQGGSRLQQSAFWTGDTGSAASVQRRAQLAARVPQQQLRPIAELSGAQSINEQVISAYSSLKFARTTDHKRTLCPELDLSLAVSPAPLPLPVPLLFALAALPLGRRSLPFKTRDVGSGRAKRPELVPRAVAQPSAFMDQGAFEEIGRQQ